MMKTRLFAGIFFVSATTLCLQLSLTRFFSVSQQYHFAFLVVSIAFLGYGSGGSFLTLFQRWIGTDKSKFLSSAAMLYALTILGSFLICKALPFDIIELSWEPAQIVFIFFYYVVLSIPFFFGGVILSFAIARTATMVNTLYFLDLLGAGAGTILAAWIFLPKGDRGVFPILILLVLISAFLFSPKKPRGFRNSILLLLAAAIGLYAVSPRWLAFPVSSFKAMPVALRYPEAKPLFTEWNAISRVDVIESPAVRYAPGLSLLYGKTLPDQLGMLIDGGELNAITHWEGPDDPLLEFLSYLPSSLPYHVLERPRVLILEPKGGIDVLAALFYRAPRIKVIENNPLIIDILREGLADFSGHIYSRDNVDALSSNGRSALMEEEEYFDLIVFALADVFGSSGTGQFGFGENYLYTMESFQDAMSRLSEDGIASMTVYLLPPPRQEIRLLATWIETLRKTTDTPEKNLIVIRSWGTISFFASKSPYTQEDIRALKEFCDKGLFDLVHYPGMEPGEANVHNRYEDPLYYDMTRQILSPSGSSSFYRDYLFRVKPITDNRPFFTNFFKPTKIKATFDSMGRKWLPFFQGEFLVPLLFIQAVGIAFMMILLPVFLKRNEKGIKRPQRLKVFLYFGLIGMSYMFVEITLIQKFILFLGHPLYSTGIILFALLFSSGTGSLLSKKILGQDPKKKIIYPFFTAAFFILILNGATPLFFKMFPHTGIESKMLITFAAIFPLGFMMGFPFPTGIRMIGKTGIRVIPWAWATNAFSSVINAVGALMIAFVAGYDIVLFLAAAGYLIAPLFLGFACHRNECDS